MKSKRIAARGAKITLRSQGWFWSDGCTDATVVVPPCDGSADDRRYGGSEMVGSQGAIAGACIQDEVLSCTRRSTWNRTGSHRDRGSESIGGPQMRWRATLHVGNAWRTRARDRGAVEGPGRAARSRTETVGFLGVFRWQLRLGEGAGRRTGRRRPGIVDTGEIRLRERRGRRTGHRRQRVVDTGARRSSRSES